MGPVLDQLPILEDQHPVRHQYAAQPVRDQQRGAALRQRSEALKDLGLAAGIEGGGGFVQNQQAGWAVQRAGGGELLPLPTRQIHATERLSQPGVQRPHAGQHVFQPTALYGGAQLGIVLRLAQQDVLAQAPFKAREVLKNRRDAGAPLCQV